MNYVVVGAQWGDEGKGKLIDFLSRRTDITARYQGGNNAGHTVVCDGREYVFHLLPSCILHRDKVGVIGNGVVIDPPALLKEMDGLLTQKKALSPRRLKISANAHVVMPYHRVLDGLRESKRKNRIGTTGRGIGPCYADKIARCGVRVADLLDPGAFRSKLDDNLREKNEIFEKVYRHPPYEFRTIYREYLDYGRRLKDYICDTAVFLNRAMDRGRSVLFEGAQGTFLDVDFGTYPFVTSSNSIAGGVCCGCGVSPTRIDRVIAAVKAYTTRVGEGPFPTEFERGYMDAFREKGQEFGATTGRPRRCGWFDAVLVRYAALVNRLDELAMMKIDVLDGIDPILVCVGYEYKGKRLRDYPLHAQILARVKPIYRAFKGWRRPTAGCTRFEELPNAARSYIQALERMIGVPITIISTGSHREHTIMRRSPRD